jgi:AraC-like DNA-binding protein
MNEPAAADTLSDVLRTVRLTGALFFLMDVSAPWEAEVPDGAALASNAVPGAQHVISYHVVTAGACWGGLADEAPVRLEAGDVLVLPRGDAYFISTSPRLRRRTDLAAELTFLRDMAAGRLPFVVTDGGGGPEGLQLVCGFLGCDLRPFNPLLATLPRLLHVRGVCRPGDPASQLVELALAESRERRAGGECVRLRLSELMFVEVVRGYLASLSAEQTGWLAGLRDPTVARALALLHERPGQSWTLEGLARHVGLSRSALADRFSHLVGLPPMQYLTQWRMQLAARLLTDGAAKVSAVGRDVGYDSEAAFSRAFKKAAGLPPARWRALRSRAGGAEQSSSRGAPRSGRRRPPSPPRTRGPARRGR